MGKMRREGNGKEMGSKKLERRGEEDEEKQEK